MATTDFNVGDVEGQIAALNSHIVPCVRSVFNGRNVNQQYVTIDTGNSNTWQLGLLIANVNGVGNGIFVVSFQGGTTANITKLFEVGSHSVSATLESGKIKLKSNNSSSNTFMNYTYIAI